CWLMLLTYFTLNAAIVKKLNAAKDDTRRVLLVWLMLLEYMVYTTGIMQLEKEQKVFDESWYWYCSNNSSNTRVFDADGRAKGKISTVRSNFVLLALGLKKVNTARRIYNC
ncbi:hypothetical protein Tco_0454742, partial [Tanacetum coccineum]